LVSRSVDSIRMWDATSRRAIGKPIDGPSSSYIFRTARLSPDGRRIAAATPFTIQQFDLDTGEPVGSPMLGNNDKRINDITYSPDRRYLVSISEDRTLRFWDTTSGEQIGEPVDITAVGATQYVHFSHDARRVFIRAIPVSLSGSPPYVGGGIWQIPAPTVWVDALCAMLVSNPSDAQWKDWISPDIPYQEPCRGKPRSH
jgi:WD40 repeat protein